jgi:hypothetical protein
MFLTHLDADGNDTPAIVVEDATAANRAVNIPEFVNVPADGQLTIDAPVAEYYRLIDDASEAMNKGDHGAAMPLLRQALATNPGDPFVHNSYGSALAQGGSGGVSSAGGRGERTTDAPTTSRRRSSRAYADETSASSGRPWPGRLRGSHAGLGSVLAHQDAWTGDAARAVS